MKPAELKSLSYGSHMIRGTWLDVLFSLHVEKAKRAIWLAVGFIDQLVIRVYFAPFQWVNLSTCMINLLTMVLHGSSFVSGKSENLWLLLTSCRTYDLPISSADAYSGKLGKKVWVLLTGGQTFGI